MSCDDDDGDALDTDINEGLVGCDGNNLDTTATVRLSSSLWRFGIRRQIVERVVKQWKERVVSRFDSKVHEFVSPFHIVKLRARPAVTRQTG